MNEYFQVLNFQIPIELRPLYEAISKEFEKRIFDSAKEGEENEKD